MEMPSTVGWADVLARDDLGDFGSRLEATIDRGFRRIRLRLSSVIICGFLVTITASVGAQLLL